MSNFDTEGSEENLLEYSRRDQCVSWVRSHGGKKYSMGILIVLLFLTGGVALGVASVKHGANQNDLSPQKKIKLSPKRPKCNPLTPTEKPTDKEVRRLLVGLGENTTMELVRLKSSSSKHLSPPEDFPVHWVGTSGAQFNSQDVLVCGGKKIGSVDMDAYCYSLKKTAAHDRTFFKNTGEISLNHSRAYAASVLTRFGWWVTGGEVELKELQAERTSVIHVSTFSTELLDHLSDQLVMRAGPDLVEENSHHCAVQLDDDHTLIAGGKGIDPRDAYSFSFAYIYNWSTSSWCSTGSLNWQRSDHACALLPDKRVLVVGGDTKNNNYASAEILNLQTMEWSLQPELPMEAEKSFLVEDDGEVLLVGAGQAGKEIWTFQDEEWTRLNRNLTANRKSGVFLTVTEEKFVE